MGSFPGIRWQPPRSFVPGAAVAIPRHPEMAGLHEQICGPCRAEGRLGPGRFVAVIHGKVTRVCAKHRHLSRLRPTEPATDIVTSGKTDAHEGGQTGEMMPRSKKDWSAAQADRDAGLSVAEIAKKYGVTIYTRTQGHGRRGRRSISASPTVSGEPVRVSPSRASPIRVRCRVTQPTHTADSLRKAICAPRRQCVRRRSSFCICHTNRDKAARNANRPLR